MARAAQLKALIESHFEDNQQRFITLALQIAASEARVGHTVFAEDLKRLILASQAKQAKVVKITAIDSDLFEEITAKKRFSDLVVNDDVLLKLSRIILECQNRDKLAHYDLRPRNKALLVGPPGTGKTMTAMVMANKMELPFYRIQTDQLISKFLGESASKLRSIFKTITATPAVYLFDEFDSIGTDRGKENEVGEIRRLLNSLLQFLETEIGESIVFAATNNIELLDKAVFRRFDDVIFYKCPDSHQISKLIRSELGVFGLKIKYEQSVKVALGLSHANISSACKTTLKEAIINGENRVKDEILVKCLKEKMA